MRMGGRHQPSACTIIGIPCHLQQRRPQWRAKPSSIGFINWAHALDHYVMLIFPTVVIGLEIVYGRSYAELIALGTPAFLAFGVFSWRAGLATAGAGVT